MMHYHQTYTCQPILQPQPAGSPVGDSIPRTILERYQQHSQAIRDVYTKYIMDIRPKPEAESAIPGVNPILQHVARMDTSYAAPFPR